MARGRELSVFTREWLKRYIQGTRPGRARVLNRKAGLGTRGRERGRRRGICGPGVDPGGSGLFQS